MAIEIFGDGHAIRDKGYIQTHDGTYPYALAPGSDGQILTVSSTAPAGFEWTTPVTTAANSWWVPIAYTAVTANTASISISLGTANQNQLLEIRCEVRGNHTTTDQLRIQVGTTSTGYHGTWHYSTTTVSGSQTSSDTHARVGQVPGSSALADTFAAYQIRAYYGETGSVYSFASCGGFATNTSIGSFAQCNYGASSGESFVFTLDSGASFVSGSTFAIYRLKRYGQ